MARTSRVNSRRKRFTMKEVVYISPYGEDARRAQKLRNLNSSERRKASGSAA